MSNVKVLPGSPTPDNEAVAETVSILRKALERAESGEIRSVALACILANGDVSTNSFCNDKTFTMLGAVEYLKARLLKSVAQGIKK
jgi:hypothetical protein